MIPVRQQIRDHPLHTTWLVLITFVLLYMLLSGVPWSY